MLSTWSKYLDQRLKLMIWYVITAALKGFQYSYKRFLLITKTKRIERTNYTARKFFTSNELFTQLPACPNILCL